MAVGYLTGELVHERLEQLVGVVDPVAVLAHDPDHSRLQVRTG